MHALVLFTLLLSSAKEVCPLPSKRVLIHISLDRPLPLTIYLAITFSTS